MECGCTQLGVGEAQRLETVARRLVWWLPVSTALSDPHRLVAQVMNLGSWSDIQTVRSVFGDQAFEAVLDDPPAGLFTARRWNYWHVRLRRLPAPPRPVRKLA